MTKMYQLLYEAFQILMKNLLLKLLKSTRTMLRGSLYVLTSIRTFRTTLFSSCHSPVVTSPKRLSVCSLSTRHWLAHRCREPAGSFIWVLMGMTQIQSLFVALFCFLAFIAPLDPHALVGDLTQTPNAKCALLVPETCCTATWLSGHDPMLLWSSGIFNMSILYRRQCPFHIPHVPSFTANASLNCRCIFLHFK